MEKLYLGIASFCLGLIIKSYLPSYMNEKGKNLATKEDIEEITQKTEEVKVEFKKEFRNFSGKVDFDYDYCYKQYSMLYANLYAIISQSEYLRYFFSEYENLNLSIVEVPFIETSIEKNNKELETPITKFDKKFIYDIIIDNAGYASPELLKLAVAYRFTNTYYGGNDKRLEGEDIKNAFKEQEIILINKIVQTIVREYNLLRKILKLEYNKRELESGVLDSKEWSNYNRRKAMFLKKLSLRKDTGYLSTFVEIFE